MTANAETTVAQIGEILRARATHHDHGDGWSYTRDTGDLEHIRYRHDYTGRNSLRLRIKRAFNPKRLLGVDSLSRNLGFGLSIWVPISWVRVSLRKSNNKPDGALNKGGVLTIWEEDGEYIEMVGPTIGERIADFLEQDPDHPHAQAIAAEIRRVWALRTEKDES